MTFFSDLCCTNIIVFIAVFVFNALIVEYSINFLIADIAVTLKRKLHQDKKCHVLVHIIHGNSVGDGTEIKLKKKMGHQFIY